jgi:hypothetical protein
VIALGQVLLLEGFQTHENVREVILDEIMTRVMIRSDHIQDYFGLLAKLVKSAPQALLNALPKV